jgi:zinc/manganese transport system permease protein
VHFVFRRALVDVSFEPKLAAARGRRVFFWDVVFYGSFAIVVTSSVRVAGVLLVFAYLIVPAALAGVLAPALRRRLIIAWVLGALLTAAGLVASWEWDLPTGPAIVSAFGAATALVGLGFALKRLTLRALAKLMLAVIAVVGLLLVAFPGIDQPWLNALENIAPPVQTAFLSDQERMMRTDMLESIATANAELVRLRELEQDVRWGRDEMGAEKAERLRQYIAGRSEISAGEQLVLRDLRHKARQRQQLMLGLPLLVVGAWGFYRLSRKRAALLDSTRTDTT